MSQEVTPTIPALIDDFARGMAAFYSLKPVYPGYLAFAAKGGLLEALAGKEGIIRSVGEIETIGDCKYAITVTDLHSQTYRITVEVAR